ncbi:MAG: aminotransferase class I/II-fold pyridoxal phosphate-dependent enzyme, partial [Acidobacteriota bacterium]
MTVPFIDLRRFEPDLLERWAVLCREISAHTQFVGGPRVAALEARMSELTGGHVVGCANGTDALQLALRAAGVGRGDRVVIPDATFWATYEAVVNVGADVITVDVDPDDLQMDLELCREAIEKHQPKAVILVHLYGWGSARLDAFRELCRERGVTLIEDGAQAWGSTWRDDSVYRDAELATISFYPAKVLGACGDAGAVVCRDEDMARTVRQLGNHGRTQHYEHGLIGWNSRMDGFSAAWLDLALDYLDERLASRRHAATSDRGRLGALGVTVAPVPEGWRDSGSLAVVRFAPADRPPGESVR